MRAEARIAFRLALAHHPLCHWFRDDRMGPLCSGCAVFWPAFAVATVPALAGLAGGASAPALLLAGAVLGLPQVATLLHRPGRLARAAVKLLGGVGVAMATPAVLFLPLPLWMRGGLYLLAAAAVAGLLGLRMRSILRTCHACPWQRDWARCPGFGALDADAHQRPDVPRHGTG